MWNEVLAMGVAIFVLLTGLINIASALSFGPLWRHLFLLQRIPWELIEASRTLTLIVGLFLIYLAKGLFERKKRAYRFSLILIFGSLIFHFFKDFDYEEMVFLSIILVLLWLARNLFIVESAAVNFWQALKRSVMILSILFLYSVFGFYLFQGQFRAPVNLFNIERDYEYSILGLGSDVLVPMTRQARWFENSIGLVGFVTIALVLGSLFEPVWEKRKNTQIDLDWSHQLILLYGKNYLDYFALMEDKVLFFSRTRKSFLAYKVNGTYAVVLGSVIGVADDRDNCLREFLAESKRKGRRVVFYGVGDSQKEEMLSVGYRLEKIGEEAVIKVSEFDLSKSDLAEIRHGVTRMKKEEVKLQFYQFAQIPWKVLKDLDRLRAEWLSFKKLPPITFSNDFYPLPIESRGYLVVGYQKGKLLGALSFLPYLAGKGLVLDQLLRSREAFNGLLEGMIGESINYYRDKDYQEISLSMAPLADTATIEGENFVDKSKRMAFDRLDRLYRHRSLYKFKKKFKPEWRPVYLGYRRVVDFPRAVLAVLRVHLGRKKSLVSV